MSLFKSTLAFAAVMGADAFAPAPMLAQSKVSVSRVAGCEMASKGGSKGKGGLFPWITNQKGTYTELATLSSYDFLGKDGDKWVGWGGMPKSVKALYNRQGTKGLLYQGMDKTSDPKTK